MNIQDKIIGGLHGVALGDAIGAPFEFFNSKPKLEYTGIITDQIVKVRFSQFYEMVLLPGCITDDTEMTIQLLKSIIENGKYVEDDAIEKYLWWAHLKNTPMGKNTRKLMKSNGPKHLQVKGFRARQLKFDTTEIESNGTLMRCFPLVLIKDYNEMIKASNQDVTLTNNNDVNRECSMIYLSIARWLVYNEPLQFICPIKQPKVIKAVKQALDDEIVNVSVDKGWVVHALYVAIITLVNVDSFQDGMDFIANHFITGDTDTIMAIAGGLLGARFGFTAISQEKKTLSNINKIYEYFHTILSEGSARPVFTKELLDQVINFQNITSIQFPSLDKKITIIRHSEQTSHQIIDAPLKKELSKHNIDINEYDVIVCSPYLRCRQSAKALNSINIPIIIDFRLAEFQYEELRIMQLDKETIKYGNIPIRDETWESFTQRVNGAYTDILNMKYDNILVIAHALCVKHLYEELSGKTHWKRGRNIQFLTGFTIINNKIVLVDNIQHQSKLTIAKPISKSTATVNTTQVVNVMVKYIRPEYDNLQEWMSNPNNVYIGRRGVVLINKKRFPEKDSIWANPFKIDMKKDADQERDRVIEAYRKYIIKRLNNDKGLVQELLKLKDKKLGCWCAPMPCHGDVLVELIKEYL